MNSRRPGRFEARLGASRKKSTIPNPTPLLRQPQVCLPDAKSGPLGFYSPNFTQVWSSASQPSLYSSRAKVYCLKKHIVTDFFCSVVQVGAFAARRRLTSTFIFTDRELQSVSAFARWLSSEVSGSFCTPPPQAGLFKPANQSKQSFLRLMQISPHPDASPLL